jgi:hypothetical protein
MRSSATSASRDRARISSATWKERVRAARYGEQLGFFLMDNAAVDVGYLLEPDRLPVLNPADQTGTGVAVHVT